MLHLILADSELETVPSEISSNEEIKRKAESRGRTPEEILLDSNFHHTAMQNLEDSERRGRPDIIHLCMLTALDTPLNRENKLRLYVHNRHDRMIEIDPETRIPRSYNRFTGLMEQLFKKKEVPPGKALLKMRDMTLAGKIEQIRPKKTIVLKKEGKKTKGREIFHNLDLEDDICVIIGGFPKGDFLSNVEDLSGERLSIYKDSLDAVTAVTHIIQFYEEEFLESTLFSENEVSYDG